MTIGELVMALEYWFGRTAGFRELRFIWSRICNREGGYKGLKLIDPLSFPWRKDVIEATFMPTNAAII